MKFTQAFLALAAASLVAASPAVQATTTTSSTTSITTPSPVQTGLVSNCNNFYLVVSGDYCAAIAANYDITVAEFEAWNPAVGTDCSQLWVGTYVCVGTTDTAPPNGVATPTPVEPGIVTNCKTFHLVVSGDTCSGIAAAAGGTVADIETWNTGVGSTCNNLWLGYYVCIATL